MQLVQKYGISTEMAKHLCHTYGSCAFAVCEMAKATGAKGSTHKFGNLLVPGFPFMEEEIEYACKHGSWLQVRPKLADDTAPSAPLVPPGA